MLAPVTDQPVNVEYSQPHVISHASGAAVVVVVVGPAVVVVVVVQGQFAW
tara:strand:- start:27 stop:176 length:150 start_codon:yes stop_codon:yes gene_type:complete